METPILGCPFGALSVRCGCPVGAQPATTWAVSASAAPIAAAAAWSYAALGSETPLKARDRSGQRSCDHLVLIGVKSIWKREDRDYWWARLNIYQALAKVWVVGHNFPIDLSCFYLSKPLHAYMHMCTYMSCVCNRQNWCPLYPVDFGGLDDSWMSAHARTRPWIKLIKQGQFILLLNPQHDGHIIINHHKIIINHHKSS